MTAVPRVPVHLVLPGGVDDPATPSGGNRYDRRVAEGLAASGWPVREHPVGGAWPRPAPADLRALAGALAALPDGAVALLDGLVAAAAPEQVVPAAGRLRLAVLVHLPLADETGLAPAVAAELHAREGRTLRAAAAVVATSRWAARRLVDRHRLPPDRVRVAVPGVDPAPLAPGSPAGSRLLCVAAVTPRKGQDLLVAALAGLADRSWSCVCAGGLGRDPGYAERVRRSVRVHRLTGRIRLVGPRTGAGLAACYAAADLLVLASHAETYGMVVTEALARGIPVVATRVGGLPEALGRAPDGTRPGLLVPPADPAALAAALREWLDRPGTRDRLRRAAQARRATLPGWPATVSTLSGILERLSAAPAGRPA
jgi:glycosyltransferase involved in cell wall biosynthesis